MKAIIDQPTPPGEGERRAQGGYQYQYAASALLVYAALKHDQLAWIGLADRQAGVLDDLVLGLADRVVGHQFKSSRFPESFGIRGLLLGADGMLRRLASAWGLLRRQFPYDRVEIRVVTTDFPNTRDSLVKKVAGQVHSAAFVAELRISGSTRSLDDWRASHWRSLVDEMRSASGLDNPTFEEFLRALRLVCDHEAVAMRGDLIPMSERALISEIVDVLPRLLTDTSGRDRWSREELLKALSWPDSMGRRRSHQFPLGEFVQRNYATEQALRRALGGAGRGYVALLGPPGTGKSTLLQTSMQSASETVVVRYLAFMPGEGQGLGRAEAEDFLLDVIAQLKRSGLMGLRYRDANLREMREQFERLLSEAGQRFAEHGIRTVIVVDGLDHITREEQPIRSLLFELPSPEVVPAGVTFVLGSQYLDLAGLPPAVRSEAGEASRCVRMEPLSHEAIRRLANDAGLPEGVNRDRIYELAEGHPLASRYLIRALIAAVDAPAREALLAGEFTYDGDVKKVYDAAWRRIENDADACRVLAYVSRAEGPIDPELIAEIVPANAVERAYRSIGHLLAVDGYGRWRIFHNSFRLYILGRSEPRFGKADLDYSRRIYLDLAKLTQRASGNDPQCWLELRYRARAEDHDAVLVLAVPARFRQQLSSGRSAADIQADIRLAFRSVKASRDETRLVGLLLSRDEIDRRADVLQGADAIVDAYLALGDIDAALAVLGSNGRLAKLYEVVDALLASGRNEDARRQFDSMEPLGAEQVGSRRARDDLFAWAARVHHFREPDQILAEIEQPTDDRLAHFHEGGAEELRKELRFEAARAAIATDPAADLDRVMRELALGEAERVYLLLEAAQGAHGSGNGALAAEHLARALAGSSPAALPRAWRRSAALLAFSSGEVEESRRLYAGLSAPSLAEGEPSSGEEEIRALAGAVIAHAALAARLAEPPPEPIRPRHSLLRALQNHLLTVGRLIGEARIGRRTSPDIVARMVRAALIFLNQAKGTDADTFYSAYQVRYAAPILGVAMVEAATLHGPEAYAAVMAEIDAATTNPDALTFRWLEFRRRIELRAFGYEGNSDAAAARLEAVVAAGIDADTPDEQVSQIARNAEAFALIGRTERARGLLIALQDETLGYALPPKKDPQYIFWREVLTRACEADPARRRDRVEFMTRLVTGMARTEGRGAAYRLTAALLEEAILAGPSLGAGVAAALEAQGLVSWDGMVDALLRGLVRRRSDLALAAGHAWARLVLPYCREPYYHSGKSGEFVRLAIAAARPAELESLIDLLQGAIEAESAYDLREQLLVALLDAVRARGGHVPGVERALQRWHTEAPLPRPEDISSTSDPFAGLQTLAELAVKLGEGHEFNYQATSAAERLMVSAALSEVQTFLVAHPKALDDSRVLFAVVRVALAARDTIYARQLLSTYRPERDERAYWDRWRGGAKLDYHRSLVELDGEPARTAAFDELADDLSRGREWTLSLLPDMPEVFDVVAVPDWPAIWERLVEQLSCFREFRFGIQQLEAPRYPRTDEELLAYLYEQALSLQLFELSRQARVGAVLGLYASGGREVFIALVTRLLATEGDGPAEGLGLLAAAQADNVVGTHFLPVVEKLVEHPDLALSAAASRLARAWGRPSEPPTRPLPAYYDIVFDDDDRGEVFQEPTAVAPASRAMLIDEPLGWTWAFEDVIRSMSEATWTTPMQLRLRCHQFIAEMGGIEAFGSRAYKDLTRKLEGLEMRLTLVRPHMAATVRALRLVAGELMHAGHLDRFTLGLLLHKLGFPAVGGIMMVPAPRPIGLPRPGIERVNFRDEASVWLDAVEEDLRPLEFGSETVLAEVTLFERMHLRQKFTASRVRLHGLESAALASMEKAVDHLPKITDHGSPVATYSRPSKHLIARFVPCGVPSIPEDLLVICPFWATQLNWSPHPGNRLVYRNAAGTPVARTIWWRDGGPRDVHDEVLRGEGCLVLATQAGMAELRALVGTVAVETRCWRRIDPERSSGLPLVKEART